jgi:thiol-disulfide isomerase/thioredoxin
VSKAYSGIPIDEKRTWVVPRWLKEAFVAFAAVSVLAVVISKVVQHAGGAVERAKSALEADDLSGAPAQSFKLPLKGGGQVDLAQFRGKPVLVNFWATWCPPCVEEMPSLKALASSYDPASFEVLAVSVDENWNIVDKFFTSVGAPPFKVLLDDNASISHAYGTSKFPESYLLDKDGRLRLKFVGPRNWLDPQFQPLLESFGARRKAG